MLKIHIKWRTHHQPTALLARIHRSKRRLLCLLPVEPCFLRRVQKHLEVSWSWDSWNGSKMGSSYSPLKNMSDFVSWDNEIPNCFIPWFQSAATSDVISGTPFLAKMLQFNLDPSFRKWSFPAATSLTKSLDPLHHKDVGWQRPAVFCFFCQRSFIYSKLMVFPWSDRVPVAINHYKSLPHMLHV